MKIDKCKWPQDKKSAVVFMIDDFANKYMTFGNIEYGMDWGGLCKKQYSLYSFLEKELFSEFPYLKIVMFLVVGRREDIIHGGKANYTAAIDSNNEFREFLKELANDNRYEIAYHGYNHGEIKNGVFVQEWSNFSSLNDADNTIKKGCHLYEEITGKSFYGGKYCGYSTNEFSDKSIVNAGFTWWCRHWDISNYFSKEKDKNKSLKLEYFNGVLDIPSNIDGSFLSLKLLDKFFSRKYMRSIYYLLKYRITIERLLDELVSNNLVVSIQEHSSPYREDSKIQTPNIISDIDNIKYILNYLKKYDLWYATPNEIAEYKEVFDNTEVFLKDNILSIKTKTFTSPRRLYLKINCTKKICLLNETTKKIESGSFDGTHSVIGIDLLGNCRYKVIDGEE